MELNLTNKTALVTGGSKGIGLAVATALAKEGARVAVAARGTTPELKELKNEYDVEHFAVDLAEPRGPERLVAAVASSYGSLDLLVNNVGASEPAGSSLDFTDEQWQRLFEINFFGVVRTVRAAAAAGRRPGGAVVNIASLNARLPQGMIAPYSAAKAALVNFGKALSEELAAQGVRVNSVSPGPVRTPLWTEPGGFAHLIGGAGRHQRRRGDGPDAAGVDGHLAGPGRGAGGDRRPGAVPVLAPLEPRDRRRLRHRRRDAQEHGLGNSVEKFRARCRMGRDPFVEWVETPSPHTKGNTMATIAVHEFISLDGVFESPTWTFDYGFDPKMGETLAAITGEASTILLGRTTYEMFAPAWRDRTAEDDPGSPFFNETEKLVVGSQELVEEWNNSTPIGAYDADAIRKIKAERDGIIYISGSGQLVRGLLRDGLVDDLHLFVYPIALGEGERFWKDGVDPTKLALKGTDVYENGVVHLGYGPA